MKKIIFVAPNLKSGGAEKVLTKIINNLDKKKYKFKLVLLNKTGNLLNVLDPSIEIIDLNTKKSIFSILKLYNIIRKENPDIVFSIIGQLNLILALLKKVFFRNIIFIGRENVVYSEWLYKDKTFKKNILNILYKNLLKKLDVIIVQSQFMADQVNQFFDVPENKIKIFYNPIEKSTISNLKKEEINSKKWKRNKINLTAVGRLEQVKNYKDMIELMHHLNDDYHLNIFGVGTLENELRSFIKSKKLDNKITMHGFVNNPYKYIFHSFVLLLTSTRESLPNVVLEASSCGTYTIAYDMPGGIKEIINHEVNGKLVEYGNISEMAGAIKELYANGYDENAVKNTSNNYDIDDYMKRLTELFESKV